MVAKRFQYEGGHSKAKYYGSVQLHRGKQPYLKGIEIFFNMIILSFWEFFLGLGPLET